MKSYEPIQAKEFKSVDEFNTFLMENPTLIYVNTLVKKDTIILLYTIVKETK